MPNSRFLASLVTFALAVLACFFLWRLVNPRGNRMEAFAASRIHRLCGFEANCKVQLGDLFEGDWDTFYAFAPGTSQADLDQVLSPEHVAANEDQRVLVLTRNKRILRAEHDKFGTRTPLDGQIEFEDEDQRDQPIVRYNRDTWLRVIHFPIDPSGTFYVLTPIAPDPK